MLCLEDEEATPIWKPVTRPYGFADAPNLNTTFMLENAHSSLKINFLFLTAYFFLVYSLNSTFVYVKYRKKVYYGISWTISIITTHFKTYKMNNEEII
jgi:hypothetical protein